MRTVLRQILAMSACLLLAAAAHPVSSQVSDLMAAIKAQNWNQASRLLDSVPSATLLRRHPNGDFESTLLWVALHPFEALDEQKNLVLAPEFTEAQKDFISKLLKKAPGLVDEFTGSDLASVQAYMLDYHEHLVSAGKVDLATSYRENIEFFFASLEALRDRRKPIYSQGLTETGDYLGIQLQIDAKWLPAAARAPHVLAHFMRQFGFSATSPVKGRAKTGNESGSIWQRLGSSWGREFEMPLWAFMIFNLDRPIEYHSSFELFKKIVKEGIDQSMRVGGIESINRGYFYFDERINPLTALLDRATRKNLDDPYGALQAEQAVEVAALFFKSTEPNSLGMTATTGFDFFTDAAVTMIDYALYTAANYPAKNAALIRKFIDESAVFDRISLPQAQYESLLARAIQYRDRWVVEKLLGVSGGTIEEKLRRLNRRFTSPGSTFHPTILNIAISSITEDGDVNKTLQWVGELIAHGANPRLESGAGYTYWMEPSWTIKLIRANKIKIPKGFTQQELLEAVGRLGSIVNDSEGKTRAYFQGLHNSLVGIPFSDEHCRELVGQGSKGSGTIH